MIIYAPDIIRLFAGAGFDGAIMPMRIIMPQLIIIGAEKIIVLQLLIPLRKDRTIVIAGIVAVLIWCILSALLVPVLHGIGTSIVWIASELTVLIIANRETNRTLNISFPLKQFFLSCIYSIPYIVIGLAVLYFIQQPIIRLFISIVIFICYATFLEIKIYKTGILQPIIKRII